jgi:L-threonylcarbamoyladenylate synthase
MNGATQVFQLDPLSPDPEILKLAGERLRGGGLVAFPTETVYGLGANALDERAVACIFEAKERPSTDPIIVHIASLETLQQVAQEVPPLVETLAQRFWPGPLTLILPRHPNVPPNVSAGLPSVAVRMPAHHIAVGLIQAAGVPVAAPSANVFSRPSATNAQHVLEDLDGRIDFILDGGQTPIGLESTVLDLTGKIPMILRPGGLLLEDLQAIIPDVQISARFLNPERAANSPGMMLKHYSPRARVYLFSGKPERISLKMGEMSAELQSQGQHIGILLADADEQNFEGATIFRLGADLSQIAGNLFVGLRALDAQGVDAILVRDYGRSGLGLAIWDRLLRAAQGRVVMVN